MMKYGVQKMVESKINGTVVNISSVTAKMGNIGQSNYAPSKAGVESMTRVAAKEFARYGVRVNCVIPGFINTPMTETVPDKVKDLVTSQIAMRRFGEVNEIADAIAFLGNFINYNFNENFIINFDLFAASDKASYVTGTSLEVSGGMI
jgi:17beta-estradiol 17-dehydrogenase / 3alpha(17beta)-hydroxysteroid dehydrogenase (NAD+) / 3-oxoacyl-[acyl-carrier protein] reductase alpha subunit